jgi:FKBP-type peptidyl-prolyl cis-trans isomerase (trigger factor)
MKTKLTLTVEKEIVEKAKQKAASRGISLSRMFEEVFEQENPKVDKSESQHAVDRLLKRLESMNPMPTQNESDKELLKKFLKEKYG